MEIDMTKSMFRRLNRYFAPFNDMLSNITGSDFSYWNRAEVCQYVVRVGGYIGLMYC